MVGRKKKKKKKSLLLQKLDTENIKYKNLILTNKLEKISFEETKILSGFLDER